MMAAVGAGEGGHEGFGGVFDGGEVGGGVVAAERERVGLLGGHFCDCRRTWIEMDGVGVWFWSMRTSVKRCVCAT